MGKSRFGVVLDAGSSGTRAYVYTWPDSAIARQKASKEDLKRLPEIKTHKKWIKKVHPGISTFGENPTLVGPEHLEPLLKHAMKYVPKEEVEHTPIFLLATAGMRLLPQFERNALLGEICDYARTTTKFLLPDCDLHIQVIPGETEGLYGWIAANYLLGGFDTPEKHDHGKGHHTYGFLDMGGASAQLAFAPNATEADRHANDLTLVRLRTLDGLPEEYRVFVTTWLGFGANEARRRYVEALLEASGSPKVGEVPDPCLPSGILITKTGDILPDGTSTSDDDLHLVGTGQFDECLRSTYPLLEKDAPCLDSPCLLNGVHVPAIDFDVNHFVGVSEYWHTTHEVFEMAHKDKSYDFNTFQNRVKEFCSLDWDDIVEGVDDHKWGKKVDTKTALEVCFKASWLINMLHDGIGIPRVGLEDTKGSGHNVTKEVLQHAQEKGFLDPFQAVDKIADTEVSWTLGKMVLYATSQISASNDALPVGFGSNVPGIPADFQFAGSKSDSASGAADVDDLDWHDRLLSSDSRRRIPGLIFFMLIVLIAVFLILGRERRTRIARRLMVLLGGKPNGPRKRRAFMGKLLGTTSYDRMLENGEASGEFELDEVDSDNDNSETNEHNLLGRSSGWATPRVDVAHDHGFPIYTDSTPGQTGLGTGSAGVVKVAGIGGLGPRTESRERLAVAAGGPGRKSRTGSPTRLKSPRPIV